MSRMEYEQCLRDHLATWGPNCGAPQSVYGGHLRILLRAAAAVEREACALASLGEKVDAKDTGDIGDVIYNQACEDCAEAIRARGGAK